MNAERVEKRGPVRWDFPVYMIEDEETGGVREVDTIDVGYASDIRKKEREVNIAGSWAE